jgi:hypothetical protein
MSSIAIRLKDSTSLGPALDTADMRSRTTLIIMHDYVAEF